MPGAAQLAADAAMRGGAGYIKLAAASPLRTVNPCLVQETTDLGAVLGEKRIAAILIGPGLGRDAVAEERLNTSLRANTPIVLDADALQLVTADMLPNGTQGIVTPHDGEMEALCRSFSIIAEGRRDRALALARTANLVVVAKGPDTVIAAPDGRMVLASPAPSWLSIAGTGDVLAGIALSRLAQGSDPFSAACEAVWLHGEAARVCGPAFTPIQLAEAVPAALAKCL